jgi:hypothetical protein
MSNHGQKANLIVTRIDRREINCETLVDILKVDLDFEDTAEDISNEIYLEHLDVEDEGERIDAMIKSLFEVPNFIGQSSHYGDYRYEIVETEFEWVVAISYID